MNHCFPAFVSTVLFVRQAEQQRLDEEEARIQEEERRRIIERANRLLYQDTDRAKTFHSAMLLSNALYVGAESAMRHCQRALCC